MARNDGRSRVGDIFGKPGTTYPYDDLAYVRIVDQRTASQDTKLKPLGTAHDRIPSAILTATGTSIGDNNDAVIHELYETLPGPWIPFTRYDQTLGPIQGRRRVVVNTGQSASLTATVKTTYEARGLSDYVSWQIEETNSDGTGTGGNPAFPILDTDFYDNVKGPVQQRAQAITATGSEAGTFTESGGTVTETRYVPINQFLLNKIVETYTVPGPTVTTEHIDSRMKNKITETRTLKVASGITTQAVISSTNVIETRKEEGQSSLLATEVVITTPLPTARDDASALIETKTMPFQYPGRIDIALLDAFGSAIGHQQPSARLVEAKMKTYWVISASKPTLIFDTIIPDTIWINSVKYSDVLHDATTRMFSGVPVFFPATTPSNSTYVSSWIGQEKVIDGDVKETRFQLLWEVSYALLTMR